MGGKKKKRKETKKRSRSKRTAFYPWIPSRSVLSKERGKKPWLSSTLGRNDTSVWPSLAHQALQNNRGRKKDFFLLLAEGRGRARLRQAGFIVSHNGSWWLQHILRRSEWDVCFFSQQRTQLLARAVISTPPPKKKRKRDRGRESAGDSQDSERKGLETKRGDNQLKLRVCKIAGSKSCESRRVGDKTVKNKETAAVVWEREGETATWNYFPLRGRGGVRDTTEKLYEKLSN